ncbi:MAG: hypothetical protein U0401_32675 [Anaerolineae bacterium]
MLPKNILGDLIQKLLYGWLIFCVGGVSSLTYFDGFLPGHEHGEHPYHLSFFEEPAHIHHLHPPQPETLVEYINSHLNPQIIVIGVAHEIVSGFSSIFVSGLNDGYILTVIGLKIFDPLHLFGSIIQASFDGQSAWVAPLEKPPSVYSG